MGKGDEKKRGRTANWRGDKRSHGFKGRGDATGRATSGGMKNSEARGSGRRGTTKERNWELKRPKVTFDNKQESCPNAALAGEQRGGTKKSKGEKVLEIINQRAYERGKRLGRRRGHHSFRKNPKSERKEEKKHGVGGRKKRETSCGVGKGPNRS